VTLISQLARLEELLIIGLEIRTYADGYWQIDAITSVDARLRPSDRIPVISGTKPINHAGVGMLKGLLLEQLASIELLTGHDEPV
jgi:hypothetical protein